jgi:hypothetical protein
MKLYNLYQEIILEEIELDSKKIEPEVLNKRDAINAAITGKYNVWFQYKDENNTVTDRYVQIHYLTDTRQNNEAISGYQLGGTVSKEDSEKNGFKLFRLDRIIDGSVTKYGKNKKGVMTYKSPVSDLPSYGAGAKYNPNPDTSSPTRIFNRIKNSVDFNKK